MFETSEGEPEQQDRLREGDSETVSTSAGIAAGHTLACLAQAAGDLEPDQGLDCLQCTLPPQGWNFIDKADFMKNSSLQAAYEHVSNVLHGKVFSLLIKHQSGGTSCTAVMNVTFPLKKEHFFI